MNPPLPPTPPPAPAPGSSFRRILTGLLVGIAPLPLSLLVVAGVSKSAQVDAVILGLFVGAAIGSIAGGALVATAAATRLGARIAMGLLIALGLFALDLAGGVFFGCLIVMGKGI